MEQPTLHPYSRLGAMALGTLVFLQVAAMMIWYALPDLSTTATFGLIALDCMLLIFQLWYGWKTARLINGVALAWVIWVVLLVILALTASNAIDRIAALYQQPSLVVQGPVAFPVTDGVARVSGDITFAAYDSLKATIEQHPELHTLQISSDGGRIAAARGMARLITENNLGTEAFGTCASACTLVFIAGTPRNLSDTAQLGFHGYRLISGINTVDPKEEEARDTEVFLAKGVARSFLDRVYATPHSQMWFPTRAELQDAGVLDAPKRHQP